MNIDDPYRTLGVPTDASRAQIAHAYRQLAQATHPDTNPDDPQAARRFALLADAYALLSDPERRARYNRAAHHPRDLGPRIRPRVNAGPARPLWAGPVHVETSPKQDRPVGRLSVGWSHEPVSLLDVLTEWLTPSKRS